MVPACSLSNFVGRNRDRDYWCAQEELFDRDMAAEVRGDYGA